MVVSNELARSMWRTDDKDDADARQLAFLPLNRSTPPEDRGLEDCNAFFNALLPVPRMQEIPFKTCITNNYLVFRFLYHF